VLRAHRQTSFVLSRRRGKGEREGRERGKGTKGNHYLYSAAGVTIAGTKQAFAPRFRLRAVSRVIYHAYYWVIMILLVLTEGVHTAHISTISRLHDQ
jgi:hypothetical protein